ncbi:MAG TPA: RAD55 family ATPase [Methanomicrobiales archaeon]|nr:RAD55 family ATPase [Methanomicrobiales archaeon]
MASILDSGFLTGQGLVLVEGETGSAQTIYALSVAADALAGGRKVVFITHGLREDVVRILEGFGIRGTERMEIFGEVADWRGVAVPDGGLAVLDSLPFFTGGETSGGMRNTLSEMIRASRPGKTILLLSEMGILPRAQEQLARAMADGVIQFLAEREGEKIRRYIHVLKMRGSLPIDRLIPFTLAHEGIKIDPRERYG